MMWRRLIEGLGQCECVLGRNRERGEGWVVREGRKGRKAGKGGEGLGVREGRKGGKAG
jgi:hypothetical protein